MTADKPNALSTLKVCATYPGNDLFPSRCRGLLKDSFRMSEKKECEKPKEVDDKAACFNATLEIIAKGGSLWNKSDAPKTTNK